MFNFEDCSFEDLVVDLGSLKLLNAVFVCAAASSGVFRRLKPAGGTRRSNGHPVAFTWHTFEGIQHPAWRSQLLASPVMLRGSFFLDWEAAFWITFSPNSPGKCWGDKGGQGSGWSPRRKWFSCWKVISRKDSRWPCSRRESALTGISAAAWSWIIRNSIGCTCQR